MENFLDKYKQDGKQITTGDFIYYVFSDSRQTLTELVKAGYLLHGSSREIIGKLKPHRAHDEVKQFGNQKGIYLSLDPIQAMFTALTGGVKGIKARKNSIRSRINDKGQIKYLETYFAVSNPENIRDRGYVYVFSKSVVDASESNEYISRKPIQPELVIQVEKEDFPYKIEKI
jgi:hypothetical protein